MNIRFGERVRGSLEQFAHRTGQPKSRVVNTAVSEWLAAQAHPRVRFMTIETGERRATLTDGPQVWTIAAAWQSHPDALRNVETVADALGLPPSAVTASLAYWADYRDEIDGILERHRAAQDDALAAWERLQALQQG